MTKLYHIILVVIAMCIVEGFFGLSKSYGQCTLSAGGNVSICPGESTTLNATVTGSTGTISYNWTPGVNTTNNYTVSPTSTTTYTVTVTGGGCQENLTAQVTVTVKNAPIASFSFSPSSPDCSDTPVSFTYTGGTCSGCTYNWNFGDQTNSTQANPTHTYTSLGTGTQNFSVTLAVTSNGCTTSTTSTVQVKKIPKPILLDPLFEVNDFLICDGTSAQEIVISDGTVGAMSSYTIDWGDGTPSYSSASAPFQVTHSYGVGIFTLSYTLVSQSGCTNTKTYPVYNISNPELATGSSGGTQGCGPIEFCFNLSGFSNNHPSTVYQINFGDDSGSILVNHPPSTQYCHEYATTHCPNSGFVFSVIAVNGCSETPGTVGGIKVGMPPDILLAVDKPVLCVNQPVLFTNSSVPGYNYNNCNSNTTFHWDFGDGTTYDTNIINNQGHVYSAPGTYTVTVTGEHAQCGGGDFTTEICVLPQPVAAFTVDSPICINTPLSPTNSSVIVDDCGVVETSWEVVYSPTGCGSGNGGHTYVGGTSSASTSPQLTFQTPGTYTLKYKAESNNACPIATATHDVVVNAPPTVVVTPPANGACAGTSGTSTADVNDCNSPVTYLWTFAGGSPTSATTAIAPAVIYPTAGNFDVTLAVTNACGTTSDTNVMQVMDIPDVQISAANDQLTICSGTTTALTAAGAVSYSWSPSTYLSSTSGSSVNVSPTGQITYTVTGTSGSCTDTETITVDTYPLPIVTPSGVFQLCEGDSEELGVSITNGMPPYANYVWTQAGGLSATNIANPIFSGMTSTTYSVSVTDANDCEGTGTVPVIVNPPPNTSAGNDITLCSQPVATVLTGFSPSTGGTGVWSGDHVTSAGVFTPSGNGQFTLEYCFENALTGCSACDEMIVTVTDPTDAFAGPDTTFCLNVGTYQLPVGLWSGSPQVSASGLFTPSVVGIHNLTVQQGTGSCQTSAEVEVTVLALPLVHAGTDITICIGEEVNLNSDCTDCPNGPLDICTWTGGVVDNPLNCAPTATPTSNTTFTLIAIDEAGCIGNDQVTVFVNSLPTINVGSDLTLCNQPIDVQLSATPVGGTWSGTGVTPTGVFTPYATGSFVLTYDFADPSSSCGSSGELNIQVNNPVVANAGPDITICENAGSYQIVGFVPSSGGIWSGEGVMDAALGIVHAATAGVGTHTLTIATGTGTCLSTDDMDLIILDTPQVDAGPGAVMCGNAAIFDLEGYTPASGGVWEGTGIVNTSNGTFDPGEATSSNSILYWYEDPTTGCRDSSTTTVVINSPPIASFILSSQGCTNSEVSYSNTSVNGNSYIWRFGDGAELTGFEPSYTYSDEGIFEITQIVENLAGCRDTAYFSNEIIHPPQAELVLTTVDGCAPLSVPFDNHSVGQYLSFEWDLGVTTSTDSIPDPIIYQQGPDALEYPISLTAINYCGSDTDDATITVFPQPQASFGTNLDAFCSPFTVLFNNTSVGLPDTFEWDFGDGTFGYEEEPMSHGYYTGDSNTDYTIWLYLENECGADTANYTITVWPNTITGFFNTSETEGCEPLEVHFTDHSDGATQISYYLGDGYGYTSDDNPVQVYSEGEYTIYQFADNGCSYDTTSISIVVHSSPEIDFTSNVQSSCMHNPIYFTSDPGSAIELFWDFGDGEISGLSNTSHAYSQGGVFTVSLVGLSNNGCTSTVEHPIQIIHGPDASFSVPSELGCSPFQVCFINTSTAANFYSWDFGDGNTANGSAPCYTFENVGGEALLMPVQLIAQDNTLCTDTAVVNIIVSPQPLSDFSLSDFDPCLLPQILVTDNQSQYANGYQWLFNDELISGMTNTGITFDTVGTHSVSLVATNQYGCSSVHTTAFQIPELPEALLSASANQGCAPLEVQFGNISTNATSYLWNIGYGVETNEPTPSFTYYQPGTYNISLIAYNDAGCSDTLFADDYLRVYPLPVADFWASPQETDIYRSTIDFYNTSYNAYIARWTFGDGNTSTDYDATNTYSNPGYWPVTLAVWNVYGCKSEKRDVVIVTDKFNVFVPNAFTPDDDGINEVFLPQVSGKPLIHRYLFRVFDRWGTVIFETNDYNEAWTGNVRGGDYYAEDEVYNWQIIIQLKDSDEERHYEGHVLLMR